MIKRYQNRKLYDTDSSCYVTLEDIADLVHQGEEFTVFDNHSQADITANTLTQIIFQKQHRSEDQIPISTLRHAIKRGNDCFSALAGMIDSGGLTEVVQSLENQVKALSAKLDVIEKTVPAPSAEAASAVLLNA